ncbi:hypothetical protein CDD83_11221 [Cordyceps sp. RAO-2017]|nr:hypothetical protein CDD83_11221 [Cordyceps sp. RAO-2017]
MDDFAAEIIAGAQDGPSASGTSTPAASPPSGSKAGGLRGGLAAIREKAGIQDRLVERLLQQVIPSDDDFGGPAST